MSKGIKKLTESNLRKEKNGSGVYKIYDSNKRLVYVGRSSNGDVKHHLVQHFGSEDYSGAKFGDREGYHYKIILGKNKGEIAEKEKELIRKHDPKGNKYDYEPN